MPVPPGVDLFRVDALSLAVAMRLCRDLPTRWLDNSRLGSMLE
jgi:hypothetical protein